ncbi:MAG: hypothetical protein ABIO40_06280 [Devosia sp.]
MPRDLTWYLVVALIGVIAGSAATLLFRGGLFRNIVVGVFVALGIGLVLELGNINLPFEPWLRVAFRAVLEPVIRFFAQLVQR